MLILFAWVRHEYQFFRIWKQLRSDKCTCQAVAENAKFDFLFFFFCSFHRFCTFPKKGEGRADRTTKKRGKQQTRITGTTLGLRMNVARMPGSIIKIWKSSKIISIQIQMAQPSVEYEQSWVCVSPMLTLTPPATAAPTTAESCKKKTKKKKKENVKYWKAPRKDVKNVKIWKLIFNSISWGAFPHSNHPLPKTPSLSPLLPTQQWPAVYASWGGFSSVVGPRW